MEKPSLQYLDRLLWFFMKNFIDTLSTERRPDGPERPKGNPKNNFWLIGLVFIILLLTGSEIVRVINRKNTGKEMLSNIRLTLAVLVLGGYSAMLIIQPNNFSSEPFLIQEPVKPFFVIATGSFYFIMTIFSIIWGVQSKNSPDSKVKLLPPYPGESRFFYDYEKKQKKTGLVRNLYEPLLFLGAGFASLFFNPFFGLPLIVCSVSYWICLFIENTVGIEMERKIAWQEYHRRPDAGKLIVLK